MCEFFFNLLFVLFWCCKFTEDFPMWRVDFKHSLGIKLTIDRYWV